MCSVRSVCVLDLVAGGGGAGFEAGALTGTGTFEFEATEEECCWTSGTAVGETGSVSECCTVSKGEDGLARKPGVEDDFNSLLIPNLASLSFIFFLAWSLINLALSSALL
ncbi:hypothetical protein WICMUC_002314 [Wickerhamomyces mucosus]|uniref:Uncharacterized protein n=1 Tax=Wickerhamomyces mucosus TaxID=1378264 RepID=A0A9P8PPG5_9ASCO|nr:hypothetical protein WICMUC_002314 [Wickerhamomyces mucosus]